MRAWLMDSYEGVDRLRLGKVADPQPGQGQVLLRVKFAALNPADAFLARAMYPATPSLPHILGRDGKEEWHHAVIDLPEGRWGHEFDGRVFDGRICRLHDLLRTFAVELLYKVE